MTSQYYLYVYLSPFQSSLSISREGKVLLRPPYCPEIVGRGGEKERKKERKKEAKPIQQCNVQNARTNECTQNTSNTKNKEDGQPNPKAEPKTSRYRITRNFKLTHSLLFLVNRTQT